MAQARTTETLRAKLFEAFDAVLSGKMDGGDAKTLATLADKIIATARLELDYAAAVSRLDAEQQGVSPGPVMLVGKGADAIGEKR